MKNILSKLILILISSFVSCAGIIQFIDAPLNLGFTHNDALPKFIIVFLTCLIFALVVVFIKYIKITHLKNYYDPLDDDTLSNIKNIYGKKDNTIFTEYFNFTIQNFKKQISDIANNTITEDGSSILKNTTRLYNHTKLTIKAVSFIDISFYWTDDTFSIPIINLNKKAIDSGIFIERIFVLQRIADIDKHFDFFVKMESIGINIFYVNLCALPQELYKDFSIYDDKIIQILDFEEPTFNKKSLLSGKTGI